jgi:hypothetical protein
VRGWRALRPPHHSRAHLLALTIVPGSTSRTGATSSPRMEAMCSNLAEQVSQLGADVRARFEPPRMGTRGN